MLGAKSRYAVTALVDLAQSHGGAEVVRLADIALRQHLPEAFLEQLFAKLRRAGLVESNRGQKGGYRLARPPQDIHLDEVMRAVDARIKATGCSESQGCRQKGVRCLTHDLWEGLERHVESYLTALTLHDVVAGNINRVRGLPDEQD